MNRLGAPLNERSRQWVATAAALALVLAMTVGWGSYLHARNTPRYAQSAPGESANPVQQGGMQIQLTSLTVTQQLVTDREVNAAPAGALWVVAVVDYAPTTDGGTCLLDLLAVDHTRWSSVSALDYEGSRALDGYCSATPDEGTPRAELIYLIPENASSSLAGLASSATAYRGTEPYLVLTPPG